MKVETMEVSEDGSILLNPDNPEHLEWFEDDAYNEGLTGDGEDVHD